MLKNILWVLTLSYILIIAVNPALGISVSYGTNMGPGDVFTPTVLMDSVTLGDNMAPKTTEVSATGIGENNAGELIATASTLAALEWKPPYASSLEWKPPYASSLE